MRSIPVGSEPAAASASAARRPLRKLLTAALQRMNLSKTGIATVIPAREYSPAALDLLERLVEIGLSGRLAETSIYLPDEVGTWSCRAEHLPAVPALLVWAWTVWHIRQYTSTVHPP